MKRRAYVGVAGAALLAGCSSTSDSSPDSENSNSSPAENTTEPGSGGSGGSDNTTNTDESDGSGPESESGSEFRGPTEENRTYVDLQYRDYTDEERTTIRENAEQIAYDELYRDVESYAGDPVTYDGTVVQNLEADTHFTFLIALNNDPSQLVYVSWTGGRFIENDTVRIWGEVLGIEIYQTGAGSERSVPAISIADMELLEADES